MEFAFFIKTLVANNVKQFIGPNLVKKIKYTGPLLEGRDYFRNWLRT